MKMLSNQKIDDIVNKVDIVSIISSYVNLVKKGRNYMCICPFHDDSNPSLTISPEKRIYKCFSCGASGNVINFVKEYEKIDFISAVKKICDISNIELEELKDYKTPKIDPEIEMIFKINNEANEIFKVTLFSSLGQDAIKYLNQRNISIDEIKKFEIGFASKKTNLVQKLLDKGYSTLDIEKSGLGIIEKEFTKDYFVDRIIFPIKDEENNIIGFSARSYTSGVEPKYLNSKENKVFKKSKLAYNISTALKSSRMNKKIIVLEGFMDVIALCRIQINNAIAIMGTSLSQHHIQIFKKHNLDVLMFLDGDKPGVKANLKASQDLLRTGLNIYIVNNQTNQDPDELINSNKIDYVKNIIDNAVHPIDYAIDKLWEFTNKNDPIEVEKFIKQIYEFSRLVKSDVLKEMAINKVCKKTNLSLDAIKSIWQINTKQDNKYIVEKVQKNNNDIVINKKHNKPISKKDIYAKQALMAEEKIFVSLLHSDEFINEINFNIEKMINPDIKHATSTLIKLYNSDRYKGHNARQALDLLKEYNILDFNEKQEKIINDEMLMKPIMKKGLEDAFAKIESFRTLLQVEELKEKMHKASIDDKKKIYASIQRLVKSNKRG